MENSSLFFDIKQSPKYDSNIERLGEHSDTCIRCGKQTDSKFWVHMVCETFFATTLTESELSDVGLTSHGFFPIGPDCKKYVPSEFIFNQA